MKSLKGIADTGCKDDLTSAYQLIFEKVRNFDLCDYGYTMDALNSEYYASDRDRRIRFEMDRLFKQTKELLIDNRHFLDLVSNELLEKETLTFRDIQRIKARDTNVRQWVLENKCNFAS